MRRRRIPAVVAVALGLVAGLVSIAPAEDVTMLNPLASSYTMRGFSMSAPEGPGWRELASAPDAMRLLYSEQIGDETINTRADYVVQAFEVDDKEKVTDAQGLAQASMSQQMTERGEALILYSPMQPLSAKVGLYEYTLVTKPSEEAEELVEHFFVALAPDKSQYLVGKLIVRERSFRGEDYFLPLYRAMETLTFAGAEESTDSEASSEAADPSTDKAEAASPPTDETSAKSAEDGEPVED